MPLIKIFLENYLPAGTEIDTWNNICYVSLVGFMFQNTRVKGLQIPFHINFEEVNLRFYVRHRQPTGWKRGVVFIKEIVPKAAITFIANSLYREHYQTLPMKHSWVNTGKAQTVTYQWKKRNWNSIQMEAADRPVSIEEGSEEEFITEHFWGYTKVSDAKTSEYEVAHPRWQVYPVKSYNIEVDFGDTYGAPFDFLTNTVPVSVFLAEGSEIVVKKGMMLSNVGCH